MNGNRCLNSDAAAAKTSTGHCIAIIMGGAGNSQTATLASLDADGFTLNWTKAGAPPANDLVVNYVARQ